VDSFPILEQTAYQQPGWPDPHLLAGVRAALADRPPLAYEAEVEQLRTLLGAVGRREALVLQGGDCAEMFSEASPAATRAKVAQLTSLADTIRAALGTTVVTIGRVAGQYAKPRTSPWESAPDGGLLPVYRGDAVNGARPDPAGRVADPLRLHAAYDCASETLAEIRASWPGRPVSERVFASHELLLLDYEEPLVRDGVHGDYCASTHFGWVGERTGGLDGAHVALAASISNPVGVKIGPSRSPAEAVELSRRLNPHGEPGRVAFITRMGAGRIGAALPPIVAAVRRHGAPVVWLCDPMHGNTVSTREGRKTRSVEALRVELATFVRVLYAHQQWPGGVHLELTPDDVTECVPTDAAAPDAVLPRFRSTCDPRLNLEQASEIVDWFVGRL
jgi:3-deoxy-7-phosphoheptulonate synthase